MKRTRSRGAKRRSRSDRNQTRRKQRRSKTRKYRARRSKRVSYVRRGRARTLKQRGGSGQGAQGAPSASEAGGLVQGEATLDVSPNDMAVSAIFLDYLLKIYQETALSVMLAKGGDKSIDILTVLTHTASIAVASGVLAADTLTGGLGTLALSFMGSAAIPTMGGRFKSARENRVKMDTIGPERPDIDQLFNILHPGLAKLYTDENEEYPKYLRIRDLYLQRPPRPPPRPTFHI